MPTNNTFFKDPNATLDYSVDWTEWLESDIIISVTWNVPIGIIKSSEFNTKQVATIWLSGGSIDMSYDVACIINTAGGRTDSRIITLIVRGR